MDCWAHCTPSSTISKIIHLVGITSNWCHIKTCGPFVDREGKGCTLTGSDGTSPCRARGLLSFPMGSPQPLFRKLHLYYMYTLCPILILYFSYLRYLLLWTQWFHRLTFSIKHLLSSKVLGVLQYTGPINGSQQVSAVYSRDGHRFPGNKHRCTSKEKKSQSYFIL